MKENFRRSRLVSSPVYDGIYIPRSMYTPIFHHAHENGPNLKETDVSISIRNTFFKLCVPSLYRNLFHLLYLRNILFSCENMKIFFLGLFSRDCYLHFCPYNLLSHITITIIQNLPSVKLINLFLSV